MVARPTGAVLSGGVSSSSSGQEHNTKAELVVVAPVIHYDERSEEELRPSQEMPNSTNELGGGSTGSSSSLDLPTSSSTDRKHTSAARMTSNKSDHDERRRADSPGYRVVGGARSNHVHRTTSEASPHRRGGGGGRKGVSPHRLGGVVPSPSDLLFRTHSAASQRTLEENSDHQKQPRQSRRSRRGDRLSGGEHDVDPAALDEVPSFRVSKVQEHRQIQSFSTIRTQGLWIGDGSVSLNDSRTSINYDGAFENEPYLAPHREKQRCDDGDDENDYNASLAATGSAYDVSGPFTPSSSTHPKRNGDLPPTNRNGEGPDSRSSKKSNSWLCCCSRRRTVGGNDGGDSSTSLGSCLWVQFGIFRDLCGRIVNDPKVELGIILLIVANAIVMGIETFDFVNNTPAVDQGFEAADRVFLILFTIESALQFIYHGIHLFSDGWLLFDFVVVILSWSLESLQVVRAFRIFRCIRLIARLEVLKKLVLAIFAVAPSMTAIVMLLVLILYVYAVMCTQLFGDLYQLGYTDVDYFSTLFLSLFTLFSMMTLEWSDVVRQVAKYNYWSSFLFSSFLILTSFILYSLIIAVVCDAVKVTEHQDEMKKHVEEKEETRQRVFALEHRVADIAQHQGVIVEQLQLALKELAWLRRDEDMMEDEDDDDDDDDSGGGGAGGGDDYDHDDELVVHDVWGAEPYDKGDQRFHATETTLSVTSACPSSPSTSSPSRRRNPQHHSSYYSSSGNSMALSAVFSHESSNRSSKRRNHHYSDPEADRGDDDGGMGMGTTTHAVVVDSHLPNDDESNEGLDAIQDEDVASATPSLHREGFYGNKDGEGPSQVLGTDDDADNDQDDNDIDDDARSLDLAAMHRRYAAS